jgi:hypothetical protein
MSMRVDDIPQAVADQECAAARLRSRTVPGVERSVQGRTFTQELLRAPESASDGASCDLAGHPDARRDRALSAMVRATESSGGSRDDRR